MFHMAVVHICYPLRHAGRVVVSPLCIQMMADLMFRKQDYDQAIFHFQQLLERKPGML